MGYVKNKIYRMPDITMCVGTNCPHKEKCYRYTAKPSDYQSYFMKPPIKEGKCEYYWGENAQIVWNQLKDIVK
jgi:hypothetical protein